MGSVVLDAYLFFDGNCRQAMEFYKAVFGGELQMQTYDEIPGSSPDKEKMKGKIIHASLRGGVINLMASDTNDKLGTGKIQLSLSGEDDTELRKIFGGLSAGGTVRTPLEKQFWGDTYGALTDKFDVEWMVNINAKRE